jgi:hypothetical protein
MEPCWVPHKLAKPPCRTSPHGVIHSFMAEDLLKTALETKAPEIKEPAPEDTTLRTGLKLGGLTVLDLRNLVGAVIVLVLACAGLEFARRQYPAAFWAAIVLAALCLVNVLWHTITSSAADGAKPRCASGPFSLFQPSMLITSASVPTAAATPTANAIVAPTALMPASLPGFARRAIPSSTSPASPARANPLS